MYIKEARISGFKKFSHLRVSLGPSINIVVGDNDSGKSTLLEAIVAAVNGQYRGAPLFRSLSEDLFNNNLVSNYLEKLNLHQSCEPPEIRIEVVFGGDDKELALYEGDCNSRGTIESGILLKIALDEDVYTEEYQEFVNSDEHYGIPIEYYGCFWTSFARKAIRPAGIKFGASLISGGNLSNWSSSRAMVSRIARNVLNLNDQIAMSQIYRRLRSDFSDNQIVSHINDKITETTDSLTRKTVKLGFEANTVSSWENSIVTMLGDIPFANVGDGTKSIVGTELALSKSKERNKDVILLEEPENHLSHTKLNMLLDDVKKRCENVQLIVTTHSSFVANKMELRNLILLNGDSATSLSSLQESTSRFFMKAPGYKTLRVLLCDVAILVEGDADELIVQRAYMDMHGGKLPIQDGIDVVSVGTSAPRFLEMAGLVGRDVVAVTDNDGNIAKLEKRYRDYPCVSSAGQDAHRVVSYPERVLPVGSVDRVNYNTLESEVYNSAGAVVLGHILNRDVSDRDEALKYMETHKTEVALEIFDAEVPIRYPEYITRAIDWSFNKIEMRNDV